MNFGVIAIVPPHAGASAPNVRAVASVILSKAVCKSPSTKVLFFARAVPDFVVSRDCSHSAKFS